MTAQPRSLGLVGAPNARDLGGLAGADGRAVRPGLVYRAPGLGRLTEQDVTRLGRCGLTDLLDLRHGSEIEVAPPDRLPPGSHVAHIPIFDPAHPVFTYVSAVLLGHDLAAYGELGAEGTPGAMFAIYRWFVSSPRGRDGFAKALRRIVEASGPLLYHCSAGKDRTGWLTAMVLTALGADRETVYADYQLTNEVSAAGTEALLSAIGVSRGVNPDLLRPVLAADPRYLDEAFAAADREFGGIDGYLRDGLDLDEEDVARLRARLLED